MSNQGHLKSLPDPEPLALKIATKTAFLASRTAKDAAILTLAQESAKHARLQKIHRDLIIQLEHKETQILRMREFAIHAQAVSVEKELELQRIAESALSTLQQEEAEHDPLKERYRNCIAELERKNAEILKLNGKIRDLSEENNAAHAASTEHEVELDHLRTLFRDRSAELAEKSSQITELNALEVLRVYGEFGDASNVFVAILSCFQGRECLEYLEEFGIFLDHDECERLTQKCQEKLRGVRI